MQPLSLATEAREATGKGVCRKLRSAGKVPGVIYGLGQETVSVAVPERAFGDIIKRLGPSAIVSLETASGPQPAMVQEIQRHPISLRPFSVDFIRVDLLKPITVDVPIVLIGTPEMEQRDVVQQLMHVVTISVLPTAVPHELEVDISLLTSMEPVYAGALELPEGVTLLVDPHEAVVTLSAASQVEVEEAEGEEGAEPDADTPS